MADDPTPDHASILFPDDKPKPAEAPGWFQKQINEAEQRLSGKHGGSANDAASILFRGDAPGASKEPDDDADQDADDPADKLFKGEGNDIDYAARMGGEMDQFALDAIKDGDGERAEALQVARDALADDFRAAGTDPENISEAFRIVRDTPLLPMTPEDHEAAFVGGMAELEQSGVTEPEIIAARQLVSDLEMVAPGTIASLEANGAGSNPKLVRMAIEEARRRGYLK